MMSTRAFAAVTEAALGLGAFVNLFTPEAPGSELATNETLALIIRGSLTLSLLLLAWLFNKAVKIFEGMYERQEQLERDVLELQLANGIEPRRTDRGPAARHHGKRRGESRAERDD